MKPDIQADPEIIQDAPEGQQPEESEGNANGEGQSETNDFIEFEGAKVSREAFEKTARERYKDQFDAFDNKSKWQAENTQKSQEIAELKRKAEYADRLMADPRFKPTDPYSSAKDQAKQKILSKFKDVSPDFLDAIFEAQAEIAGLKSQEAINPINQQQGERFEKEFLASHKDVTPGSKEYYKIAEYIGKGIDSEDAYGLVFKDTLVQARIDAAIKTRDEDAKRKLKQSKTTPASGKTSTPKTFDEAFEKRWAEQA